MGAVTFHSYTEIKPSVSKPHRHYQLGKNVPALDDSRAQRNLTEHPVQPLATQMRKDRARETCSQTQPNQRQQPLAPIKPGVLVHSLDLFPYHTILSFIWKGSTRPKPKMDICRASANQQKDGHATEKRPKVTFLQEIQTPKTHLTPRLTDNLNMCTI